METLQSRQTPSPSFVSKRAVLFVSAATSFLMAFIASSINIALPSIQEQFKLNAVLLSWVPTSYLLAAAVSVVPFGRLADIHGRKKIITLGILLFTISSLVCGTAFSATMLIIGRIFQGIGSAMTLATRLALVTDVFPPGERGSAIGLAAGSVYLGLSVGPVLGGFLTELWGWRSIFLICLPLSLVTVVPIGLKIQAEWADAKGETFDLIGSLILGISLILLMIGMTGISQPSHLSLVVLGLLGIGLFVRWELKQDSPVFQVRLFKESRVFAFSSLTALFHYSATYGVIFLLSLYLQYIKSLSPYEAGAILIIQPAILAVLSPLTGRLSDRIEPVWVSSCGLAVTALGLFLLSWVGPASSMIFIMFNLFVIGSGSALFASPNVNAIMSAAPKRYRGIAGSTVSTMRLMGQMASMGIATLIFALILGRVRITPDVYHQFLWCVRIAFIVFAVLCLFGIAVSLARGKLHSN